MTEDTPTQEELALEQIVRAALSNIEGPMGEYLPHSVGSDESPEKLDIQYLMSLIKSGRMPQHEAIAVDAFGKLDVDHDNPGPVISPEGQITSAGYLSLINEDELAAKRRKERKRELAFFSSSLGEDLQAEQEGLSCSSSVSSVSNVSAQAAHYDHPSSHPPCGADCWLQGQGIFEQTVDSISSAPPTGSPPSGTQDLYIFPQLAPQHTRILCLKPGMPEMPIVGELSSMNIYGIDENSNSGSHGYSGKYEAISYNWGSHEQNCLITCNGSSIAVTEHLYSALLHFRLPDKSRYLWVDALCINQKDVVEKNTQVQCMMSIFKGAESVLVWLGDSAEDSHLGIAGMQLLDDNKHRMAVMLRSHGVECMERLRRLYNAQAALFLRPYFHRSWIRQEIAVAKKISVCCGNSEISWYSMKRSAKRLQTIHKKLMSGGMLDVPNFDEDSIARLESLSRGWIYGQPVTGHIGEIRSIWYYHAGGLLDLLMVGSKSKSTDPRDKVYSLLGLGRVLIEGSIQTQQRLASSESEKTETMLIDYSKSVSEVYQYLAKYLINRDRNLDVLCILYGHRNAQSDDLPSWTPDWRVSLPKTTQNCSDYFSMKFAAAGFTKADYQDQQAINRLTVRGYCVDIITSLLDATTYAAGILNIPYSTPTTFPTFLEYTKPFDPSHHLRRCCETQQQRYCLVPSGAQPGDGIFVLLGSKLPFVLRAWNAGQKDKGKDRGMEYEVIGPCCVPDLMYGWTIKLLQNEEPERVVLV